MQPPQQHSWINLAEIKGQLMRKLGPERSRQYFDYLNRFLSLKLSKAEFDKLCLRTVGKDNIRLHNQLIRSILKNACSGEVPTGIHHDPSRTVGNKKPSDGAYHQNGSIPLESQVTGPLALANGDILPPSPRKARTGTHERRSGDRRSALGPNGKTNYATLSSSTPQSVDFSCVLENGNSSSPWAVHHHQQLMQQAENGNDVLGRSPDGCIGVHREDHTKTLGREDGKRVSDRTSLHAPIGVPYCPVSIGGACRALPLPNGSKCVGVLHTDGLLETLTLRERMEQIAAAQGLQGVSIDCANVLNSGLDAYLRGLIRSCADLNGDRSVHEPMKSSSSKRQAQLRPLNGVRPGHYHQIQSSSLLLNAIQEHEPKGSISLLDFRVAMELNRQQLGEDWPILLEKICIRASEE